MAASLKDIKTQIDHVARASGYSCKTVSWEDATRGTVGGSLSCLGANIADVRLWEKSGRLLYTVRSANWDERLGFVAAKDVTVVVGNHSARSRLQSITLQEYLDESGVYATYSGVQASSLACHKDDLFSIRFQTVFLPVEEDNDGVAKVEFCTDVLNYNTMSDEHPRNALLLCTAQGTSFQQDGSGTKKMYHHEVDPEGGIHRYWLEAQRTMSKVGGAQEEKETEAPQGKSSARRIGTQAMGTRFNVQMLVQLPVEITQPKGREFCEYELECEECCGGMDMFGGDRGTYSCRSRKVGRSNAARVSRGTEEDVWDGLAKKDMKRDEMQRGTITVTVFYTVAGGIPSERDVQAAISDLNSLFTSCSEEKRLSDASEITAELTVNDAQDFVNKVSQSEPGDAFDEDDESYDDESVAWNCSYIGDY